MPLQLSHIIAPSDSPATRPPLLIVHGLYGSARNFSSLARKLAVGRDVVMVDMRNHGASPWADTMTYPDMAGDLADTVERLCGGRAVVMGHSMGGKAAMALALTRPDLVETLVVADIAPVPYDHSHAGYIAAMQSVDLGAVTRRSDADPMLAEHIPEAMLRAFLLQNLLVEGGVARWRLNLDALETCLADLMGWPEKWPHMPFEGRTLFLHGGASEYVTVEMHPTIRAHFPAAAFQTLEGAGHWLHAEQPDAFQRQLEASL